MPRKKTTVYLIHFQTKYRHAGHYLGFVDGGEEQLAARLERHRKGDGARLMQVVTEAGIQWELARTWAGDRKFERRLKKKKNSKALCPICSGQTKQENA